MATAPNDDDDVLPEDAVAYDDESVLWQGSPSQIVNIGTYLWWIIVTIGTIVFLGLWGSGLSEGYAPELTKPVRFACYVLIALAMFSCMYAYLLVRSEYTVITKNKIKESRGISLMFRRDLFCEISDITDIKSPPAGIMGLFGLSTLVLETKDDDQPIIKIRAIKDREALVSQLMPVWRKLKVERKGYFGDR